MAWSHGVIWYAWAGRSVGWVVPVRAAGGAHSGGSPLRAVCRLADEALAALNGRFEALYSSIGRPSIPPSLSPLAETRRSSFMMPRGLIAFQPTRTLRRVS